MFLMVLWLTLAGISAPRPTYFLCWCKESKQRKHLECATRFLSLTVIAALQPVERLFSRDDALDRGDWSLQWLRHTP
jgi:hypothetical protein